MTFHRPRAFDEAAFLDRSQAGLWSGGETGGKADVQVSAGDPELVGTGLDHDRVAAACWLCRSPAASGGAVENVVAQSQLLRRRFAVCHNRFHRSLSLVLEDHGGQLREDVIGLA